MMYMSDFTKAGGMDTLYNQAVAVHVDSTTPVPGDPYEYIVKLTFRVHSALGQPQLGDFGTDVDRSSCDEVVPEGDCADLACVNGAQGDGANGNMGYHLEEETEKDLSQQTNTSAEHPLPVDKAAVQAASKFPSEREDSVSKAEEAFANLKPAQLISCSDPEGDRRALVEEVSEPSARFQVCKKRKRCDSGIATCGSAASMPDEEEVIEVSYYSFGSSFGTIRRVSSFEMPDPAQVLEIDSPPNSDQEFAASSPNAVQPAKETAGMQAGIATNEVERVGVRERVRRLQAGLANRASNMVRKVRKRVRIAREAVRVVFETMEL